MPTTPASLDSPKEISQPQARWTWPLSGCPARISSPPGRGRLRASGREREAGTCERSARLAHPSSPGNAPPPALTEDQDVLAGRQLGPGAGGHFAQDRGPVGITAKRSAPGLVWTRPDLRCPRQPITLPDGPAQSGRFPARPRPPRPRRLSPGASRSYQRLWPSSSSLVRSPAAATAGPLGPSSSFFSTPTGAILPTAATKRALPRARRGPARTLAGSPAARRSTPHATRPAGSTPPAALRRAHDVRELPQGREAAAVVEGGRRSGGRRGSHAQRGDGGWKGSRPDGGHAGDLCRPSGAAAPGLGSSPSCALAVRRRGPRSQRG